MPDHSGIARIQALFLDNLGVPVNGDQLREASGIKDYPRRVRELRALGWPIESRRDNLNLEPDEYVLTGEPPAVPPPQFARRVSQTDRAAVLLRNNSVCQLCGRTPGDRTETGRRVIMHVDHIEQQREGGAGTLPNLRTLCSDCNEGSRDVAPPVPLSLARLKGQVRGATEADQREVYEWLRTKFD